MGGLPKSDEDYINTQILDVDNTGLKITQDIVVSLAVTYIAEKAVMNTVYQLGGKQALGTLTNKLNVKVTKEMMDRIAAMANKKLVGSFTNKFAQLFSKQAAQTVLKSLGKTAAASAARAGVVTAGGCTLGPVGCAAGAAIGSAVFAAELAFSVYNIVQDIQDKKGILNLYHKEYVDYITKDYKDMLVQMYTDLGQPEYMEEEAQFYPEVFLIDFEPDGTPYMDKNNTWALKFIEYQSEYLKSIGVEDGWEDRITTGTIDTPVFTLNIPDQVKTAVVGVALLLFLFLIVVLVVV